jgi:hypothetical protein
MMESVRSFRFCPLCGARLILPERLKRYYEMLVSGSYGREVLGLTIVIMTICFGVASRK